jgi:hypothetical protein
MPEKGKNMEPRIRNLSIRQFRTFRDLKIEGLGRVNLFTGRNNTGKSTVLEAVRLLASGASPSVIHNILRYREEDLGEKGEHARPADSEGKFSLSSLFHGFPSLNGKLNAIEIASSGGERPMELSIAVGWYSEERHPGGARSRVPMQGTIPDILESEALPGIIVTVDKEERVLSLEYLSRYYYRGRPPYPYPIEPPDESSLPCMFVSPYGGEGTATLGRLWDEVVLSDRETDVVKALGIIDPKISAVSMVGEEATRQGRKAIVRTDSFPRPVPLRSFGDGMNRLFGIVLNLVNAKDGLLLIDEFENGLHYTVQVDVWRVIFGIAKRLGIQVMATSHSWDAIEAFQKVASADPEEGVLIRLSRKGEDIIPTLFREDELAIATRDRIEVR